MNLIIINSKDVNEDLTVSLSTRQSNHCIAVLDVSIGSKLNVGVMNSGKGTATVVDISSNLESHDLNRFKKKDAIEKSEGIIISRNKERKSVSEINLINNMKSSVVIKLDSPFHRVPYTGEYPLIDLIIALPRPKVFEKVIQFATTAGTGRIFFVCTNKSEKSYLNSSKMKKESIDEIVQLCLEQSCTTLCPEIYVYASWFFFLKHLKTLFLSNKTIGIVGDVSGNKKITEVGLQSHDGPVILAIGPEGGWTPNELEDLVENGFNVVNIGERILKVEMALISLFSKTELLLTDIELRNGREKPKRDKYWIKPNEEISIITRCCGITCKRKEMGE
ncbi:hypothetical protein RS030_71028 [Cryptosporidium xiaoi]|uniref:16S rRNA (uracil(1498)-N(3))-methyltransferase n=1 Tax=Cryptosporidium xiaoi TaxID=659607 RepID=A0AAV9XVG8_9CRYT